ncbi:RNA directed DNA polymerase [Echinococcus multilocularis]|uniref:RNA directed DNA polymerase n=1 Tax=Echinococcus multilocularis TaxID=6211 RepID=A0A0S4MI98_ECHMU|nr:RNA directed DNA polymerase [Echinococcus multilocularis]
MPFGLCNAAATFQRLMQAALIGLFPKHCIIYLDDILVFGGDIQEHNANLKLVLDRLRDAGLTLNPKKCRFLKRSVTFLRHTVSSNGIAVTDDRVQQVRTWPTPTIQTELRSFLALPNFESSAPPFILDTDASDAAVGGVLSQKDIKDRDYVIAYASTRLGKKKGDRKVRRNNRPSGTHLVKNMKEIDRLVALWCEELQQYYFTVQYRKGKGHGNADALSRRPTPAGTGDVTVHTVFLSDPTRHHWRNTQSTDPDTALIYEKFLASSHKPASEEITSASKAARRIWQEWWKLSLEDEILWYQGVHPPKRLVVPKSLVQTVLQELHEQLGHVGEKKMLDASSRRYWWSSLTLDVRDFCRTCTTCSGFKNPQPAAIAPLQPMPTGFPGKRHGVPESVHSDQGPNFESQLCIELCKICQISKTRTTPAHPQGNGKVERTNRTLIGLLKAFTKDAQPDDWDLSLGRVLLEYRATVHTSTGVSPFKMLTGREMRVPSDVFVPNADGSADNVPEQKKYFDRHCRTNVHQEGDLVQIYRPIPPPGTHRKFHHPWSRDPFRVVKALSPINYLVRNAQLRTQPVTVHHNKMRPYKGPPPVGYEDEDGRPPVRNPNRSS